MNRKLWVYSGLLVVVLALMGFGTWFVLNSEGKVKIPEEEPLVIMDVSFPEGGALSQLSIYEDGTVIHVRDWAGTGGLRPGDAFTRTWRTGKLKTSEIDSFFSYLETLDFNDIETTYISESLSELVLADIADDVSEISLETGNYIKISADNGRVDNVVAAFGYVQGGIDLVYELPYPVNFIYTELIDIIENHTEEVMVEELTK
ncbi:hypothetical protein ACFLXY_00470 [Chloroflexota bacterium]